MKGSNMASGDFFSPFQQVNFHKVEEPKMGCFIGDIGNMENITTFENRLPDMKKFIKERNEEAKRSAQVRNIKDTQRQNKGKMQGLNEQQINELSTALGTIMKSSEGKAAMKSCGFDVFSTKETIDNMANELEGEIDGGYGSSKEYDHVYDMMEEIRDHAKLNGRKIDQENPSNNSRFMFLCKTTVRKWSITAHNFKNSAITKRLNDPQRQLKLNIIFRALETKAGKENLLSYLNSKA